MPLLGPVVIPATGTAWDRHREREEHGYHATSLYNLVQAALRRVREYGAAWADGELLSLTVDELVHLGSSPPHAFRHTFATIVVECGTSIELAQEILGHANITTTHAYVQARQKRIAAAAAEYFSTADSRQGGTTGVAVANDAGLAAASVLISVTTED